MTTGTISFTRALLLSSAILGLPAAAWAQDTGGGGSQQALPANDGEIVVTATRQAQVLSRVPISVSAFNQESMDQKGVKSFAEVARFTPGVTFAPGSNSISIRGISSGAGAGTTGIYIDDTPIQMRGLGFSADNSLPGIFDLERVEVLRGPQGTLFGAGSEGGTVRYITPQPGLTDYTGMARAEISQTQHGGMGYEAGAAVGGPLIEDKIGFRVSAWHRKDAGWIDRVDNASISASNPYGTIVDKNANSGKTTVLRGALSFQPTEDLLITPTIQYQKRTTKDDNVFYEGISNPGDAVFRKSSPEYRWDNDKYYLASLNIQLGLGAAKVISNTSYFHRNNLTGYDGTIYNLSYYQEEYLGALEDGRCEDEGWSCRPDMYPFLTSTGINQALPFYLSPALVTNRQRNFTQEVRIQSDDPSSPLTWVAGVFYQSQRQTSIEELIEPATETLFPFLFGNDPDGNPVTVPVYFEWPMWGADSYITDSRAREKQLAFFADVTYALTDQLKVTAGARYAKMKYSYTNFADGSQNFERTEGGGSSKENPFTPKLSVSYQADPNNLFYATWSKGYRAGGANPPIPVAACAPSLNDLGVTRAPDSYKSDKVTSWEIGSKNRLFDRKLSLATSVYNIDWTDIQQSVNLRSCSIQYTGNLGSARSRGFDLQATILPFEGLTIDAMIGYTDAYYTKATVTGPGRIIVNKGNAVGGAPWTWSLGGQYDFPLGANEGYIRADWSHASKRTRLTASQDPAVASRYDPTALTPDATDFVSLRAGTVIGSANISVFVDNLFDATPMLSRGHSGGNDGLLFTRTTFRPRTFGLTLTYRQ